MARKKSIKTNNSITITSSDTITFIQYISVNYSFKDTLRSFLTNGVTILSCERDESIGPTTLDIDKDFNLIRYFF
jgi:hypothetical protein